MTNEAQPISLAEEFKKNPDITPEDLRKLQEWLKTQPHLPGDLLTDLDLLLIYYCCDKSSEVSKQVLDLHYTLRTLFNDFFKDRVLDQKVITALNTVVVTPLATPTIHGYHTMYFRILDPDPRHFNFPDTIRALMMLFDLYQYQEGTWPGFVIIINMDKTTMSHIMKLEVMTIRQVLYFLQECMLVKLKAVHFINAPYFMDKLMMILKPFMKKTLLDMIHIHQINSETLYKYVQKSSFPKEDGGEYKSLITLKDESITLLKNNEKFIAEENRRRVDESRRPGTKKTIEDVFGIQGSFKKLDID